MKLKTFDNKGEVKYIEISFWSFVKCYILANLTIAGITLGIWVIILLLIIGR